MSSCIQSSCVIGGGGYYLKPTSVFSNRLFVNFASLGPKRSVNNNRSLVKSSVRGRRKNWSVSIKSVLEFDHQVDQKQSNDSKVQVANLEDILAQRGSCGVGFIANLDNKGSHQIVQDALTALGCMEHRGGCGADNDSGDGSGVMTAIPWDLFSDWADKQGLAAFDPLHTGVGMVFLPQDEALMEQAKSAIVNIFNQEGLEVLAWRSVPVNVPIVGFYAKETMPNIQQVFVKIVKEDDIDDIERELYICRKLIEKAAISEAWGNELYFCSLSNQTIVYKGMLRSEVLGKFYFDLQNDVYKSPFAIYHRRYSTNTSPRWPLAQPMRLLGHNGEINTIQVTNLLRVDIRGGKMGMLDGLGNGSKHIVCMVCARLGR